MKQVVVEMHGVHYINSCGIGSLVGALTTLRRAGGDIRLAEVRREVHGVFVTTKLDSIFHFHTTLDEALAAATQAVG
jgi:anti-sigma B factor antagonist